LLLFSAPLGLESYDSADEGKPSVGGKKGTLWQIQSILLALLQHKDKTSMNGTNGKTTPRQCAREETYSTNQQ